MSGGSTTAAALLAATLRPERRRVGALVAVLLAGSIVPLAGPAIVGAVVDGALAGRSTADLGRLAALYLVVAVVGEGLALALTWESVQVAWRAGNRLRERLAAKALELDLAWHGRHTPGELLSRIDGDVDALTTFFANIVVQVVGNVVLAVGIVVAVTVVDWRVGLVLAAGTALALAVTVRLRSIAVDANEQEREAAARLYGDLEERLGGLEDLRANGGGDHALRRLHDHSALSWRAARSAWTRGQAAYAVAAALFSVGSVATLAAGALLHRHGALSVGAVLALFRYAQMLRQPLERVAEQLPELQKALAGARRAAWLLAEAPAVVPAPAAAAPLLPAGPLAVELDQVLLAYDDEPPVLRDLDLVVPAGSTLGLVGRTGSGKTSVGRLLLRLWDPTGGTVRIGGVDLRDVPTAELRTRVAVVTQDVELLRASVRDNLTMLGHVVVDDATLRTVLASVGLDGWLAALPDGLDTVLDGSAGLSAGQAQLVAFARAFLTDPGLVVLDEASSRLDPATEALVADATDRLLAGRTAVVIAHRLATLERVDAIGVVDHGRLVEHGPRVALAADRSSRYGRLLATAARTELLAASEAVA